MILDRPAIIEIDNQIKNIPSKRARILEALRLILNTITTQNGYTRSVCEVTYDVKGWDSKTEDQTPILYIIDDQANRVPHAGCIREYQWRVRIYGVVHTGDTSIVELEQFISDIEQCVYDNNTLASQVNHVEIDSVTTDNQLFSVQTDKHLFEIVLMVNYTRKAREAK